MTDFDHPVAHALNHVLDARAAHEEDDALRKLYETTNQLPQGDVAAARQASGIEALAAAAAAAVLIARRALARLVGRPR